MLKDFKSEYCSVRAPFYSPPWLVICAGFLPLTSFSVIRSAHQIVSRILNLICIYSIKLSLFVLFLCTMDVNNMTQFHRFVVSKCSWNHLISSFSKSCRVFSDVPSPSLSNFINNSRNFKADYKINSLIVWKTLTDKLVVLSRNA